MGGGGGATRPPGLGKTMRHATGIRKCIVRTRNQQALSNRPDSHLALRSGTDNTVVQPSHRRGLEHLRSRSTAPLQPIISYPPRRSAIPTSSISAAASCRRSRDRGHPPQSLGALAAPRAGPELLRSHGDSRHRLALVVLRSAHGFGLKGWRVIAHTVQTTDGWLSYLPVDGPVGPCGKSCPESGSGDFFTEGIPISWLR